MEGRAKQRVGPPSSLDPSGMRPVFRNSTVSPGAGGPSSHSLEAFVPDSPQTDITENSPQGHWARGAGEAPPHQPHGHRPVR